MSSNDTASCILMADLEPKVLQSGFGVNCLFPEVKILLGCLPSKNQREDKGWKMERGRERKKEIERGRQTKHVQKVDAKSVGCVRGPRMGGWIRRG